MSEQQRLALEVRCPVCLTELAAHPARRGFTAWCPYCRVRVFLPRDADTPEYRQAVFDRMASAMSRQRR
jgi:hypothetical protein